MRLNIKHDIKRLERDLGRMGKEIVPKALAPALNRTTATVKSVAVKSISGITGIKPQKTVRDQIRTKKADKVNLAAYIDAFIGRAGNLRRFVTPARAQPGTPGSKERKAKPQFFRKRNRDGSFKYRGVEAKAWNKKKVYDGTFIARGKSGNVLVFARKGPDREAKLKSIKGPSVRRELVRPSMRARLTEKANERFPIELKRSLDNVLRRMKRK